MVVYRVMEGDTLFDISVRFNVPVERLMQLNEIEDPRRLVVGQAILVASQNENYIEYTVREGDTVWKLGQRFGSSIEQIARVNSLTDPSLIYPGQGLIIPNKQEPSRLSRISQGYFFPAPRQEAHRALDIISPILTYLALFEFGLTSEGDIIIPENVTPVVESAKEQRIVPLMTITNLREGDTFEPALARNIMATFESRQNYINQVLELIERFNFDGVNVNFENMYPEDRGIFTAFVAEMKKALGDRTLSIAMPAKWDDLPRLPWVGTFDYRALGAIVDFAFIMTYEWAWFTGPPGPIAPVENVRRVLEYALDLIDREKIMQGLSLYGYRWQLPQDPQRPARAVGLMEAVDIARRYGVSIQYAAQPETPWFEYTDEEGTAFAVWFEDVESIWEKLKVNIDLDIGGIGYWSPSNEPYGSVPVRYLINALFDIIKYNYDTDV